MIRSERAASQGGYILLSVVLMLALVASLVATYSQSAVLARTKGSAPEQMRVETNLDSGLAFARQSLLSGLSGGGTVTAPGGEELSISVDDSADGLLDIQVTSTNEGTSRLLTVLAEVYYAEGGDLPTLTEAARTAILASPLLINVDSDFEFEDEVVDGILLVAADTKLKLTNTVLRGSIVSANAMTDDPVEDPIEVELKGAVIIEPVSGVLAGCAIVAPDAEVKAKDDPRLQSHGVIVAQEFKIENEDDARIALHRQLVVNVIDGSMANVTQLGLGRGPQTWPTALRSGSQGITRLVFDRQRATTGELDAIKAFTIGSYVGPGETVPIETPQAAPQQIQAQSAQAQPAQGPGPK